MALATAALACRDPEAPARRGFALETEPGPPETAGPSELWTPRPSDRLDEHLHLTLLADGPDAGCMLVRQIGSWSVLPPALADQLLAFARPPPRVDGLELEHRSVPPEAWDGAVTIERTIDKQQPWYLLPGERDQDRAAARPELHVHMVVPLRFRGVAPGPRTWEDPRCFQPRPFATGRCGLTVSDLQALGENVLPRGPVEPKGVPPEEGRRSW